MGQTSGYKEIDLAVKEAARGKMKNSTEAAPQLGPDREPTVLQHLYKIDSSEVTIAGPGCPIAASVTKKKKLTIFPGILKETAMQEAS